MTQQSHGPGAAAGNTDLVSLIEPFLDLDMALLRAQLIDEVTLARFRALVEQELAAEGQAPVPAGVVRMLAEMKAELYYLKAAYLESSRYREPDHSQAQARLGPARAAVSTLTVDLRAQITGRNWYDAEPDGRWAGPGTESSIMVPALQPGTYDVRLEVALEFVPDALAKMQLLVNGEAVAVTREGPGFPCALQAVVTVGAAYALPFWVFKLRFHETRSPASVGATDTRSLAAQFSRLSLVRRP